MPTYNSSSFPISYQMESAVWFTEPAWIGALAQNISKDNRTQMRAGAARGLKRLAKKHYPEDTVRAWVVLPEILRPAEARPTSTMISMYIEQSIAKFKGVDIAPTHSVFPEETDTFVKGIVGGVKKLVDDRNSKRARAIIAELPEGLKITPVWSALDATHERFHVPSGIHENKYMYSVTLDIQIGAKNPITITISPRAPKTPARAIKDWSAASDDITPVQRQYYANTALNLVARAAVESMGPQKRELAKTELKLRLRQADRLQIPIEPLLRERITAITANAG